MATISASIPDQLKAWIEIQIKAGRYTSTSDYLRDIIRNHQAQHDQLEQLLLEGLYSGPAIQPDDAYWEQKKNRIRDS